jgi:hypothetical protein
MQGPNSPGGTKQRKEPTKKTAVELAAKSLHVHQGKRNNDLLKLGHSLIKACDAAILAMYGITLSLAEQTELKKMSELNECASMVMETSASERRHPLKSWKSPAI